MVQGLCPEDGPNSMCVFSSRKKSTALTIWPLVLPEHLCWPSLEGAHAFRGHSSPRSYPDVKMIHASARQAFFENSSTGAVLHCPDNLLTTLHCLRPMRDTSSLCALKPPHPLQSVYCRHFTHKLWLLLKMCTGQFEVWGAPALTLTVVLLLQICSINQNFPWFFLKIE